MQVFDVTMIWIEASGAIVELDPRPVARKPRHRLAQDAKARERLQAGEWMSLAPGSLTHPRVNDKP